MRLTVVLSVVVLCLACALGAAEAAKPKREPQPPRPAAGLWEGVRMDSGTDLRFRVLKGRARVGRVKAIVLQDCLKGEPQSLASLDAAGGWKVTKAKFGGSRLEQLGRVQTTVTVAGQFTSPIRVSGVLRMKTVVNGTTCDSGRLPFVAVRAD